MENSEFLKGSNKAGWKASFDWVFKNSENWMKILEGNYPKMSISHLYNMCHQFVGKVC